MPNASQVQSSQVEAAGHTRDNLAIAEGRVKAAEQGLADVAARWDQALGLLLRGFYSARIILLK